MAVADYTSQAVLLSDGSGSFTEPPYGSPFSTGTTQYTHSAGLIQRLGAGWGSFSWATILGPATVVGFKIGAVGEGEFEVRGADLGGANWDAYSVYWDGSTGWTLYRTVNGATTTLTTGTATVGVGDTVWIVALGDGATVDVAVAIETGGSVGADFLTYSDTNAARLVAAGYVGAWANGTTLKIDEFYAATLVLTEPGYIVQESDGTSQILLEDGSGSIVTETFVGTPTVVVDSGSATASGPAFTVGASKVVDAGSVTASGPAFTAAPSETVTSGGATGSGPTVAAGATEAVSSGTGTASGPTVTPTGSETVDAGSAAASGPDAAASASETVDAGSAAASGPTVAVSATETVGSGSADAIGGEVTVDGGTPATPAAPSPGGGLAFFPETFPAEWAGERDDEETVALVLALTLT